MQARLYLAGLTLAMLSSAASGAESCTCRHLTAPPLSRLGAENTRPQFEPEANNPEGFSSFRGVRLDMQESDAQQALERLGYALVSLQTTETGQARVCFELIHTDAPPYSLRDFRRPMVSHFTKMAISLFQILPAA